MQNLKINGVQRQFSEGLPATLSELLTRLDIDQATVVAEINGAIVRRADFADTPLEAGQAVELVRLVGGG